MYCYLFYKLYKFAKWSPSIYPSDFGAVTLIGTLELGFLFSIQNYWMAYTKHNVNDTFFSLKILIVLFLIIYTKWLFFWRKSKWKIYVNEFDKLPKRKNIIGTWLVVFIVVFILTNAIVSSYLFSPYRLK